MEKRKPIDRLTESGLLIVAFFIPLWEAMIYVGILLVLIGWIYKLVKKKSKGSFRTPLDLPIIIFAIIGFISTFNSLIPKQSLMAIPIFVVGIFLSYYLVLGNITDKKFLKKFILAMILGGTITACLGIFQHLIWGVERSYATLIHINTLAGYLTLMIPIVLSLLFYAPKRSEKILLTFSLITMIICLIFTRSRSGWLALVGAMSFLVIIKKEKRLAIGLTLVIIVVVSLLIPSIKARLRITFDLTANKDRICLAKSALQMIKDHPLTGIGVNTFYYIYPQYQLPEEKVSGRPHAHNVFLQIGAEMGLFAIIIFLWLLVRVFKIGWKTLRRTKDEYLRTLVIGLLASLIAFLISQEFDFMWSRPNLFIFFWILLAMFLATRNIVLKNKGNS